MLSSTSMLAHASVYVGAFLSKLSMIFMTSTADEKEEALLLVDVTRQTDDLTAVASTGTLTRSYTTLHDPR